MNHTPLKDRLARSVPTEEEVDQLWLRVQKKQKAQPSIRIFVYTGAALAAVALAFFFLWPAHSLLTEQGEPLATALRESTREIALNDGSALMLSEAQMRVRNMDSKRVELDLSQGAVGVFVKPKGPRTWSFFVGDVRVDVVGTRFDILHAGKRVRVAVQKGLVAVSGDRVPGGSRMLAAGEVFDTGEQMARAEPTALPPSPPPQVVSPLPPALAPAHRRPVAPAVTPPTAPPPAQIEEPEIKEPEKTEPPPPVAAEWRALARIGDFASAAAALGDAGLDAAAASATSAEDLFVLADIAAVAKRPSLAISLLDRIIATSTAQARAVASYKKGIFLLGQGQARAAAETLDQALELGLPQSVRAQARERAVDAWIRAGEPERARRWEVSP